MVQVVGIYFVQFIMPNAKRNARANEWDWLFASFFLLPPGPGTSVGAGGGGGT